MKSIMKGLAGCLGIGILEMWLLYRAYIYSRLLFGLLLLSPVWIFLASIPFNWLRRRHALQRDGYHIGFSREHRVVYEERIGNEIVYLPMQTEQIDVAQHDVVVPSIEEWNKSVPAWAQNRREEICKRVMATHPKDWVQLPDDWAG